MLDAAALASFDEAGADPSRWGEALRTVSESFGGLASGVRIEAPDGSVTQLWHGLPEDFERDYLAHYHKLDPWMPTARSLPVGRCVPSQALVPDRVLEASEFFQDFLRPRGLREIVGGIVEQSDEEGIITFAVMRADGASPFDAVDAARLEQLIPRIRHARWIDRRLSELERPRTSSRVATFVLDVRGCIRSLNAAAEQLLAAGDAVFSRDGRLCAVCPLSDAALSAQLRDAFASDRDVAYVALRRLRGPALIACASPLGERVPSSRVPGPRPGVLVLVHDPFQPVDVDLVVARLRQLYGLTPAEARVATLVGAGHSPREAAVRLGLTPGTVRFQLKQAYARADLTGQRELVRLVSLLSRL